LEPTVVVSQLRGIPIIEDGALVQFRVTALGGVRTKPSNSLAPSAAGNQHPLEMNRVRAVDHVVGGIVFGLGIGTLHSLRQRVARGNTYIRFGSKKPNKCSNREINALKPLPTESVTKTRDFLADWFGAK
jgi:hypothetical protein